MEGNAYSSAAVRNFWTRKRKCAFQLPRHPSHPNHLSILVPAHNQVIGSSHHPTSTPPACLGSIKATPSARTFLRAVAPQNARPTLSQHLASSSPYSAILRAGRSKAFYRDSGPRPSDMQRRFTFPASSAPCNHPALLGSARHLMVRALMSTH